MAAEDLLVYDGGHGQAVEAVGEGLPQLDVVAAFAWNKENWLRVNRFKMQNEVGK